MQHTHRSTLAVFLLLFVHVCEGNAARAAESQPVESKLFVPSSMARFELVLGRLQLSSEYFRIGAAHERTTLNDGRERTRSISISILRGKPALQFRDHGGDEEIQLSFKADRQVDISQATATEQERYKLIYHQPQEGPVSLRVEFFDGRTSLEFKSNSLWHLAMAEPHVFDAYIQPCLSRLDPGWQIACSVTKVRDLMNNPLHQIDIMKIGQLIEQLDADSSTERDTALKQLDSMGIAAEPSLRQSLSVDLSSQQHSSIRRLLSTIRPSGSDTPMRVAVWLSGEWK